jgi:hypothetical protein
VSDLFYIGTSDSDNTAAAIRILLEAKEDMLISEYNHKQESSMKHKITVAVCLIVVIAVGLLAYHAHHDYQIKQNQKANRLEEIQLADNAAKAKASSTYQAGVQTDEEQCARDQAAYSGLTAAEKVKTAAPVCVTNIE